MTYSDHYLTCSPMCNPFSMPDPRTQLNHLRAQYFANPESHSPFVYTLESPQLRDHVAHSQDRARSDMSVIVVPAPIDVQRTLIHMISDDLASTILPFLTEKVVESSELEANNMFLYSASLLRKVLSELHPNNSHGVLDATGAGTLDFSSLCEPLSVSIVTSLRKLL